MLAFRDNTFAVSWSVDLPLTIGIELEVNSRQGRTAYDIVAVRQRLDEMGLTRWVVKYDGSAFRTGHSAEGGLEINSPICRTWEDVEEIAKITGLLRDMGFQVNNRCGLHVHLGVNAFSREDRARFYNFMIRYRDAFFALVSAERQASAYCHQQSYAEEIAMIYGTEKTDHHTWLSVTKYGTVEFRLAEATLSSREIIAWVKLLVMIAEQVLCHGKQVRRGYAKAKTLRVLVCTMIEQAGYYERRSPWSRSVRPWALSRL